MVKYSFKFKLYAVKLYLSTEGSYQELAKLEFLLLRYYGSRSLNINNGDCSVTGRLQIQSNTTSRRNAVDVNNIQEENNE